MQLDRLGDFSRTHTNGALRSEHIGQRVQLLGWCKKVRNLGGLFFLDLRDRWGLVQLIADPDQATEALMAKLKTVRPEFVLGVEGLVRERESKNPNLPTGDVEVLVADLKIFNTAQTPPFQVDDEDVSDELRLKYRFLDLRRARLQRNLILRSEIAQTVRAYFRQRDFVEIETPILTKSTPEGARDYLVPSRVHPGEFFALPQSPQLFKQLMQVAGYERYFQICRCFRDEDLRADRQPEFTQVDVEMSFVRPRDIHELMEGLMVDVCALKGQDVKTPFLKLPYAQAMEKYGSDKPDLRFACEIQDVTPLFQGSDFTLFAEAASKGHRVRALGFNGEKAAAFSRKQLDELAEVAKQLGAGGLPWIKWATDGLGSSFKKFVTPELEERLKAQLNLPGQALVLLAVGPDHQTSRVLGELRLRLGQQLGLIDDKALSFLWVVDFPLLEWNPEDERFVACHHPFTSPHPDDLELLATDPGKCRAQAYDLVLNGYEVGGGSIRIHDAETQSTMFRAIGIEAVEAREKFGFLLDALSFGAPPHGGIALGLDRLAMLMAGETSIRDVIAFPKTAQARCLMTESPSPVSDRQLRELHLDGMLKSV